MSEVELPQHIVEAVFEGTTDITVKGEGESFVLMFGSERLEESSHPTYTAALERAIFIVNEVG